MDTSTIKLKEPTKFRVRGSGMAVKAVKKTAKKAAKKAFPKPRRIMTIEEFAAVLAESHAKTEAIMAAVQRAPAKS